MAARDIESVGRLRRVVGWTLVASLCVAAMTAIVAIVSGDFDDTDGRVIATSVVFGVSAAIAGSGAALRYRESPLLRALGLATMALTAASFVLFVIALWSAPGDDEVWRWFGCAGFATLAASHACLVTGSRRATDSGAVRMLAEASIVLAVVDATVAILVVSQLVEEVDEQAAKAVGVLVVLLVLTSALQPVLRRLQRAPREARSEAASPLAEEVLAATERIEALNADPGNRSADIRRECERLRELARTYAR